MTREQVIRQIQVIDTEIVILQREKSRLSNDNLELLTPLPVGTIVKIRHYDKPHLLVKLSVVSRFPYVGGIAVELKKDGSEGKMTRNVGTYLLPWENLTVITEKQ